MGVGGKSVLQAALGKGSGIYYFFRPKLFGCQIAYAVGHSAMGQGRSIFHHQDALVSYCLRLVYLISGGSLHYLGSWIYLENNFQNPLNRVAWGTVHLVYHQHMGAPEIRLSRMIEQPMAWPERIKKNDFQIGANEWKVVVATIPQDDLRVLRFNLVQNFLVVNTGKDYSISGDQRLVLFSLFNRTLMGV